MPPPVRRVRYPGSALTRVVWWRAQQAPTAANESATYVAMVDKIIEERASVSYSVYTQTTDLENECDGFLNYDRVNKFSDAGTKAIHDANQKLVLHQDADICRAHYPRAGNIKLSMGKYRRGEVDANAARDCLALGLVD